MFNRAFVYLNSTFIFLFSNKRNFILVISFGCYATSLGSEPLCYYKGMFEIYLTELKVRACFPLSGLFYLVLFVLSLPTIGLTNGDTSKASSK